MTFLKFLGEGNRLLPIQIKTVHDLFVKNANIGSIVRMHLSTLIKKKHCFEIKNIYHSQVRFITFYFRQVSLLISTLFLIILLKKISTKQ